MRPSADPHADATPGEDSQDQHQLSKPEYYMQKLTDCVTKRGGKLPPGWTVEVKRRRGKQEGQYHAFFKSPTGKKFDSITSAADVALSQNSQAQPPDPEHIERMVITPTAAKTDTSHATQHTASGKADSSRVRSKAAAPDGRNGNCTPGNAATHAVAPDAAAGADAHDGFEANAGTAAPAATPTPSAPRASDAGGAKPARRVVATPVEVPSAGPSRGKRAIEPEPASPVSQPARQKRRVVPTEDGAVTEPVDEVVVCNNSFCVGDDVFILLDRPAYERALSSQGETCKICGEGEGPDGDRPLYECDFCLRGYHKGCSTLDVETSPFRCGACVRQEKLPNSWHTPCQAFVRGDNLIVALGRILCLWKSPIGSFFEAHLYCRPGKVLGGSEYLARDVMMTKQMIESEVGSILAPAIVKHPVLRFVGAVDDDTFFCLQQPDRRGVLSRFFETEETAEDAVKEKNGTVANGEPHPLFMQIMMQ